MMEILGWLFIWYITLYYGNVSAKRPTASDEVARGRLVSLDGFSFAFLAKNGEWRDLHFGFPVSFASP